MTKKNAGDSRLEQIVKNTRIIGVKNPVLACQNVFLYEGNQVYGEIDALIFDAYRGWIHVEEKANDTHKQRMKAYTQLIRNLAYAQQECVFDKAELLYVYGKALEVYNLGNK